MKEQIERLLGRGLSQVVVANAVGCTEGYISQLLAEEDFAGRVAAMKLAIVEKDSSRGQLVNEIKDELLAKTKRALPMLLRPQEIIAALKVIDGLKCGDSASGVATGTGGTQQIVQVNLPTIIMQNFIKNSQNEIVEVGGRSLATLSPMALKNMLHSTQQQQLSGVQNEQICQDSKATAVIPATAPHQFEAEAA